MLKSDAKIALIMFTMPIIGFITFIVFLNLKLYNYVDWNWFWIWLPLWLPWAIYAVLSGIACGLLAIASGRIDRLR